MTVIADISWRSYEESHSALMDVVARWRKLGATDRQVGELLLANALPFFWEGEPEADLVDILSRACAKEIHNLFTSLGGGHAA